MNTWTVICGKCTGPDAAPTRYEQTRPVVGNLGPTVCRFCSSGKIKVTQHVVLFDRRPSQK
jgi:hypothetical protein